MKKVVKSIVITFFFITMLIQTGCWDRKLYEEIGFILQVGLENDQSNKLVYSVTYPVVVPEVSGKVEYLHTSTERLLRASREKLRDSSGRLLQGGKTQFVYFSKDLAKKGISEFMEIFLRDPENPLLANIIVVDGSPKEMLELSLEYKDKPRSAFYVANLITDARKRFVVPETRVYNFSILKYSKTIDPIAPYFRYDKTKIEVAGSVIFNGDKLAGEIDTEKTILLNGLIGRKGSFEYIYKGEASDDSVEKVKKGTALTIGEFKRKIKIDIAGGTPVINIKLDIKANLDEYTGENNLDENENKSILEEKIAKSIQDGTLNLLKYLQSIQADPVGFGEMVRAKQNKYWKAVNWKEVYKDALVNVDVKLNIQSYGDIR